MRKHKKEYNLIILKIKIVGRGLKTGE